ncbi:hypothetical protein HanHA89_Chr08g0285561 [Helianthus annuus]|nr:hypothetical protein HanHA89_Chr08g0285561 [Helianthus annuus]
MSPNIHSTVRKQLCIQQGLLRVVPLGSDGWMCVCSVTATSCEYCSEDSYSEKNNKWVILTY